MRIVTSILRHALSLCIIASGILSFQYFLLQSPMSCLSQEWFESKKARFSNDHFKESISPTEPKKDTYTLVVVRCKGQMDWLMDVPQEWRLVVYEKCGLTVGKNVSGVGRTEFADKNVENTGAEECNGYLDYIQDYYNNLTDVTIFVHDDVLQPYSRWKDWQAHTPFHNFTELVKATDQFMSKDQGFLHFGVTELTENWGKDGYHGQAMKALWPFLASSKLLIPPLQLTFKPSAHFAVRKERILSNDLDVYKGIKRLVYHSRNVPDSLGDSRQFCCAMERQWHILFGEPPVLRSTEMITDLMNITQCSHPDCRKPK